jgi:Fic family protein
MPELSSLIQKIDSLKSELDKLLPMKAEDQQRLDKKFRLEWNYNSNHIEGNTLTYGQTELLIMFGKTTGDHDIREYQEMKAHDAALILVKEYANDKTRHLSEADIRELNRMILVEPYYGVAWTEDGQQTRKLIQPGVYKKEPNSVRLQNGEMFHYASPDETPIKMAELMDWFRKVESEKKLHPIQIAAQLHYDFVRIHPFDDSNGRTSRLLMNYVLIRHGFPPVVIKSADKKNYLTALNKADVGDLDSFVEYIAEELVWSLDVSIKAAKSENIEEFDDVDKELSVWKRKFTSNNKGLPKSIETIDIMLSNGLSKILQDFALRCNQFKDVFPVSKVYFEYSTFRDSYNKAKKIFPSNEIDPLNISNYAHQVYLRNLNIEYNSGPLNKLFYERIDFISLIFVFEGLISDNGQIIDLEFSLVVRFEKFEYSILFDNVKVVSKRYSLNSIGSYEEDEIINKLMKLTFNLVKSKIP